MLKMELFKLIFVCISILRDISSKTIGPDMVKLFVTSLQSLRIYIPMLSSNCVTSFLNDHGNIGQSNIVFFSRDEELKI